MVFTNEFGARRFFLRLLLLVLLKVWIVQGQQVGASLELLGVNLPSDSLVDLRDLLDVPGDGLVPTPDRNLPTLHCFTDLVDCCNEPRSLGGEWYFPNGTALEFDFSVGTTFRRNRGPNGNFGIGGSMVYGVVRLFRRGDPPLRGRFLCEVPTAANPTVNQVLYVNILNIGPVTITPSGGSDTVIAGTSFSLVCSATVETQTDSPTPNFEWFFGPNNVSVPSGATPMATVMGSGNTYTSTLQFSPLQESHAGMYTCRLGGNARLAVNPVITVNRPDITVTVIASGSPVLGQSGYSLACDVTGQENLSPTITYQWTRDNGTTQTQVGTNSNTLSFSSLSLSDAGRYTCSVIVSSPYLNSNVMASSGNFEDVIFQIPNPSVTVTSNPPTPILDGTDVTVTCTVEMAPGVMESDLSLIMVDAQLSRDGTPLTLTGPAVSGITFTYTIQLNLFGMNDSGEYNCTATVIRLQPSSTYLTGSGLTTTVAEVVVGIPTTTTVSPGDTGAGGGGNAGAIAGGVIVFLIAIAAGSVLLVILFIWWWRRRSTVPYKQSSHPKRPPAPVAYARTPRKDDVALTGVTKIDQPQILKFPSDTNITEGEGVYFKIKVSGVPQPTVTWYHDGEPIKADYARDIETDNSLVIPSTELKHSGVYKAVVANQHGSEEKEVKLTVSEEGGATLSTATANGMVSTKPVPIPEFGKYVAELHSNANQPFKDLYQSLDTGEEGHIIEYATNRERKPLNRFGNIVVYDDNRITLNPLPDVKDCQRDYINACYVDGYSIPNKFIATQGPLPKTIVDFWRLIWQERPPTIVMVTNVKEGNRIKCQQYWPDSGKKEFGPFQVIITDQQIFADYTIRTLSLSFGSGRSHKVTQYHFTAWPDHGVPDYATPILAFHRRVKAQHHPSRGPLVVHCSAGVGRTGTFIVIDNILEQIEKEQVVDIPGAITKIRHKRMKMVQTHEQFTFIHDAILESVTCGDTQISATNLRMNIAKMRKKDAHNQPHGFQYQFKILDQVSPNPEEVHCGGALTYPDRSRSDKFLPGDRWRVVLKGEQPDYIHAVNINGYKHKRAFIVAEGPMQNTVRNFWKMIYDRKCAVVVMVSGLMEEGQEASALYWPDNGIAHYGEFAVDLLGEEPLQGFTIRTLSVMDTKTQKAHQVTQFHITCWTADGCCSNLKSITDVIEEMTKVQIRSGNKPIVVHCNDTVTRSGMFCAISTTIERCKTEGVVDVFQVVKALRVQKPGAVPNVENYKLIFNAILVYLESFDTYANFQNI